MFSHFFYPPMPEIVTRVEGHRITAIASADEDEVMKEQLEYLVDHASICCRHTCSECEHYDRVRQALLEAFGEPRAKGAGR